MVRSGSVLMNDWVILRSVAAVDTVSMQRLDEGRRPHMLVLILV